jgi:5-methylcytosine-specific restriction endonuclease McrA
MIGQPPRRQLQLLAKYYGGTPEDYRLKIAAGKMEYKKRKLFDFPTKICARCKATGTKENWLTIQHVVPKREKGGNVIENVILLCRNCHNWVNYVEMLVRKKVVTYITKDDLKYSQSKEFKKLAAWLGLENH